MAVGTAAAVLAYRDPAQHNLVPLCIVLAMVAIIQIGFGTWCWLYSTDAKQLLLDNQLTAEQVWDDHEFAFVAWMYTSGVLELLCAVLFAWHRKMHLKRLRLWSLDPVMQPRQHPGQHDDSMLESLL